MKSITLTQLEYVRKLSKLGHFGKAARACFVTQPTLSMQIQKLESELGVLLFDRNVKPIVPTAIGRKIVEVADNIQQQLESIEETIKGEGELKGEFRLGLIPTLAPYLLPRFIHSFVSKYPAVDLTLEELQTHVIVQRLREGTLDSGLLVTPLSEKGIRETPLFKEPFVLYVSEDHPLSKSSQISEKELSAEEVWLLSEGHCFRDQALNICKSQARSQKAQHIRFESGNLETLRKMIDVKRGYTLLPTLAALELSKKKRERQVRPFREPIPSREVSLVTKEGFLKVGILKALAKEIESCLPPSIQKRSESRLKTIPISRPE